MYRKADRKLLKTKEERMARDIIDFLLKNKLMDDTFIYVNGKRYGTYDGEHGYNYGTTSWDDVYVEDNLDPKKFCEWAGKYLSLSTEGVLYDLINYNEWDSRVPEHLNDIFKKYGYYYELCTAWFLTAAKL
jgi:hypothetical protein